MNKRTAPHQLPSAEELKNILAGEVQRPVPEEKEKLHFGDFSTIVTLLDSFSLSTTFFTQEREGRSFEELLQGVYEVFDQARSHILQAQHDREKQKLFHAVYGYLAEEDMPEPADILFVFGSQQTFRIEKAIELYEKGYAPKILISGKGPFYQDKDFISEAERLALYAREHGVLQSVLVLEKESITIADNIKRSLILLEEQDIPHERIILVNAPFVQRRGWAHMRKMTGVKTKIFRANAFVSERFSRDGWYRDEVAVSVILKEFFGLRFSHLINTS